MGIEMKHFPAICFDDFYDDPDSVREFALSQEFLINETGVYPGVRTNFLHEINPELFDVFCNKLFSIFYDFNTTPTKWVISTSFQLIKPFSTEEHSIKNHGWVHLDDNKIFAGVIYLTPNIDISTGTSLYKIKDNPKLLNSNVKYEFYKSGIADDSYDKILSDHNNSFVETVRFNNVYNRMIAFDGTTYHKANSYYSEGEQRLCQVFFLEAFQSSSTTPIQRSKLYKQAQD